MRRFMIAVWVLIAVIVVGMGYIRLAPSDPVYWHKMPDISADADMPHGAQRVVEAGGNTLGQLDAIIRATPRTQVLAGSVDDGMITYVTRSRIMGFPDYTTVSAQGDQLMLYARLRFGQSDLGVNRARVDQWLAQLERVAAGS